MSQMLSLRISLADHVDGIGQFSAAEQHGAYLLVWKECVLACCCLTHYRFICACRTSKKRVDCKIKEAYKLGKTLGTGGKPQQTGSVHQHRPAQHRQAQWLRRSCLRVYVR
jgi:hypothetical protein